jgi:hypothetical protein
MKGFFFYRFLEFDVGQSQKWKYKSKPKKPPGKLHDWKENIHTNPEQPNYVLKNNDVNGNLGDIYVFWTDRSNVCLQSQMP